MVMPRFSARYPWNRAPVPCPPFSAIGQAAGRLDQAIGQASICPWSIWADDGRSCGCSKWGQLSWARDSIHVAVAATILQYFQGVSSRQADSTGAKKRATHGFMSTASILPAATRAKRLLTIRPIGGVAFRRAPSDPKGPDCGLVIGFRGGRMPCSWTLILINLKAAAGRSYGRRGSLWLGPEVPCSAMGKHPAAVGLGRRPLVQRLFPVAQLGHLPRWQWRRSALRSSSAG